VRSLALVLLALGCALVLAGCGSSDKSASSTTTSSSTSSSTTKSAAPAGTIEALWQKLGGEPVAIVPGTTDYGPGKNRVSFLVVNSKSQLIESPTARVWISRGLRQKPFEETTATLVPIGVPGGAKADAQNIYVATVNTPKAGKYWMLAQPVGAKHPIQALGDLTVGKHTKAPSVGDNAIPSVNPVLKPGVKPSTVTTAEPPDTELLKTTVAAALAAKKPFVVTFATPEFCQSRTCGPVVQVVQSVAKQWRGSGVDFIHIEIYKDNDPSKGTNQWVDQWKLPSEPFTFVVDKNGVIRQRFEGAFSSGELQKAVKKIAG
jgi:hypothetical protein